MLTKKSLPIGIIAGAMMCFGASAQNNANPNRKPSDSSSEVTQQTKTTTNSGTNKTNADIVYGKVESFEPGKSIKVSVPGKIITSKSFDLSGKDLTANVPSSVKVGDWVRVRETDESNGHKLVTVSRSSESAAMKAEKPQ